MLMPLTDECRLIGLKDIDWLLQRTLERNSHGYSRTEYVNVHGGIARAVSTKLNEAASRGNYFTPEAETIAKLAKIILIPGANQYFGDTIEGMSRFVGIYEGWGLDGIPPHLEHLRDTQGRSFGHMSLDELKIARDLIDALIEETAIDLDAVVGTNHRITAYLEEERLDLNLTRSELAKVTIGLAMYLELIAGSESLTAEQLNPLAIRLDVEAAALVLIRDRDLRRIRKNAGNIGNAV